MKYQQGIPREQLQMLSFESIISPENPVRFIDSFVEHLDLSKLNFQVQVPKKEGRPSFESKLFLKIYLYGYLNGLRSSRRLEKECARNIELHWLLNSLVPNYHSISDFRKNNPDAPYGARYYLKKIINLDIFFKFANTERSQTATRRLN